MKRERKIHMGTGFGIVTITGCMLVAASVLHTGIASGRGAPQGDEPSANPLSPENPLVERAKAELAQLDVTVRGDPDLTAALRPEHLRVWIGHRHVEEFLLDSLCSPAHLPKGETHQSEEEAIRSTRPASIVFYFDQLQLTGGGRDRALALARELMPQLVTGGNQAMIASNAEEFRIVVPFTKNVGELLEALRKLESDTTQRHEAAGAEAEQVAKVHREIREQDTARKFLLRSLGGDPELKHLLAESSSGQIESLVRRYQVQELQRADKSFQRLSLFLAGLSNAESPKAVFYFADTLRANAGEHYFRYVPETSQGRAILSDARATGERYAGGSPMAASGAFTAEDGFDQAVFQAAAMGVRLYTVQAEGLVPTEIRVQDAQSALKGLALETGGEAFLNSVSGERMAARFHDDLSCMYLLSFDPEGFPEDEALPVRVRPTVKNVQVQTRGRLVIQSEEARRTSRRLAALLDPRATKGTLLIRASLVPLGFDNGLYGALLQVSVRGAVSPGSTLDLEAALVGRGRVRGEATAQVGVDKQEVSIVLEHELEFPPDNMEVVALVYDQRADELSAWQGQEQWPDPSGGAATVGPIALLQPEAGAFLRDGEVKTSGSRALAQDDAVLLDRPVAAVGLVCRGKRTRHTLRVERRVEGDSTAEFEPIELDLRDERCAQVRDLIPMGTLGPGYFMYEIKVLVRGKQIAQHERSFLAIRAPGGNGNGDVVYVKDPLESRQR